MTKQQAARVRQLIRALRSGKFKQCRNRLRSVRGDRFCASGVACELYSRNMKGTDGVWQMSEDGDEQEFQSGPQSNCQTLPYLVRQWLGFPDDTQAFIGAAFVHEWNLDPNLDVERVGLELLNDGVRQSAGFSKSHRGMNFKQIACVLERWLRHQPISD